MGRRTEPHDLYTVLQRPDLDEPVLLVHFEGWIDAGASAAAAMAHIHGVTDPSVIVRFDTERLLDHRARRPTMHIVEGVNTGLDWPTIEMAAARDARGRDLLLLHGAEPDHNWRAFVDAVVTLARSHGVSRMIGLGAYPAAVPHTRPSRLSVTASTEALAEGDYTNATLDVPAGMESALERALADAGIPTLGLWAQVPHYVPAAPYPAASLALLEGLTGVAGIEIDSSTMAERAAITRGRLDALVAEEEAHRQMVAELEHRLDESIATEGDLPSPDELAAQVERFLREHGDEL